jgi:drug/metabolite transporter (DMT)-like permease
VSPRLQILGAALLFSTGGAAIKACSFSAWQVACLRSGIAAVALFLVLPEGRRFLSPRTLAVGAAYGTTMLCFVGGNKLTTAANTIFLQSTAPLYLLVLGPWLLHEKIRRVDVVLMVSLGVGLAFFFVGIDPPFATAPDPFRGNLFGALAGASWALTILGLRWLGRSTGSVPGRSAAAAVIAGNLIAAAVALPLALPLTEGGPVDWTVIVYLGLFQIGLAYVFLTRGVRGVPALEVSLLLLLEPVLSVVWAWLVHGERPGSWSAAGCAIILVATLAWAVVASRAKTP